MYGSTLPSREERGVSEIVGTILMIGVVAVAMTMIAYFLFKGGSSAPTRFVDFSVRVENTDNVENVRLIITHQGGDKIQSPAKYISVWGHEEGAFGAVDNQAYERPGDNGFSSYGEFDLGDNAVLYIRQDGANVVVGDYYRVRIYDNYAEKVHYERVLVVQPSSP